MKRLSVFSLTVYVALSLSAASPYLDFITYAERDSAKNLIRDLSSVFSETGEPLMTDLYVIGRTWAEVQYFNLVSFENWTLENIKKKNVRGVDWNNVKTQVYKTGSTTTYRHWYVEDGDTVGIIAAFTSRQVFNPKIRTSTKDSLGLLEFVPGAFEMINENGDTMFVKGEVGGSSFENFVRYKYNNLKDDFYWDTCLVKEKYYGVFRYDPWLYYYSNTTGNPDYSLEYTYYDEMQSNSHSKNISSFIAAIYDYNYYYKDYGDKARSGWKYHADGFHYVREGNGYRLQKRWDALKAPIGMIQGSGKKIYLSGKLLGAKLIEPFIADSITSMSLGAPVGKEAGFLVLASNGRNDIYLEDFQISTKTLIGTSIKENTSVMLKLPREHISAPITLMLNGNDTHIHVKGRNLLQGSACAVINTLQQLSSTPIVGGAIVINVTDQDTVHLTLDDKWLISASEETRTNGYLKISGVYDSRIGKPADTEHYRSAPAIYSGNRHSVITFDGGRYKMSPSESFGTNVAYMCISRKEYSASLLGNSVKIYDVGSDIGDANVKILGGSFSMTPLTYAAPVLDEPIQLANGKLLTKGNYVMYMPLNTQIQGGTFENCVVRCTDGAAGVMSYISGKPHCPTNADSVDVFDYKIEGYTDDNGMFIPNWDSETDADTTGYDFSSVHWNYNEDSLGMYIVTYLPGFGSRSCEETNLAQNWEILAPSNVFEQFHAEDRPLYATIKRQQGMDLLTTKRLAILDVNPYFPRRREMQPSTFTEQEDYEITEEIQLMTWTMADQWRVLTMPYNVTGILLSETYIVDSMGYIMADSLGYSVAGDSIRESNIYKAGVQTWVVTSNWFQLDHELGANRSFSNIYGRSLFLRSYYSRLKKDPVTLTMPRVMKALKPLQFRKDNRLQGDYDFVLYEAADTLLPTGETQLLWRIPQVGEDSVLMHQGRTYALFFPKDSANGGNGYNWNGKYIFLEGQGSNTIRAKATLPADTHTEALTVTGNNSFQKHQIEGKSVWLWDNEQQQFLLTPSPTLMPMQSLVYPVAFNGEGITTSFLAPPLLLPESGTATSVTNRNLMHAQPRRILQDGIITIILPDGTKILPDGRKVQ